MKRLFVPAALIFTPLSALADVTGTWKATFDTQIGEQSYTFELKVDGTELTGTAKSSLVETASEIVDGRIEDDTISFIENLSYQGTDLVISYLGRIVSDDEIEFTRSVGEFATEELVATRAEEQDADSDANAE